MSTEKKPKKTRKPKTKRLYFGPEVDESIIKYNATEDSLQRSIIYQREIKPAFEKLVENIIHTFKFYYTDGESIEDVQQEVIAFLLEKLRLYKPEKGKAYSYFGTIAKRYLILKNKKNYQKLQDKGDLLEVDEDKTIKEEIINEYYGCDYSVSEFMKLYIKYIDKNLNKLFPKDIDARTADAVIELFRKCESLDIFNKKALYIYIREMVDVDTPQITKIIKKLKTIYVELYGVYYRDGHIKV